jgi:hypothetical protein
VNRHIKSIVRLHRVEAVGPDPHHFKVQGGTFGESGQEIAGPLSCTAIRCCASIITIRNPGRNACAGLPAAMPTARRAAPRRSSTGTRPRISRTGPSGAFSRAEGAHGTARRTYKCLGHEPRTHDRRACRRRVRTGSRHAGAAVSLALSASNNIQPVLRAPRLGQNLRFLVIECSCPSVHVVGKAALPRQPAWRPYRSPGRAAWLQRACWPDAPVT